MVIKLRKTRQEWAIPTRVLGREGAGDQTLVQIYLAVAQSVLLYHSDTWVMNPLTGRVLGGFHYRVDCRLTGRQPRRGKDDVWIYPPLEDAMAEAGLQEVETYVSRCQNIAAQFIAISTIIDLCLAAERRPGPQVSNW